MKKSVIVIALSSLMTLCQAAQVPFTIGVTVPFNTPQSDTIYLVGNMNSWDTLATPMQRMSKYDWSVTLNLELGEEIEFKFTRGSWETREIALSGDDPDNRTYVIPAENRIMGNVVMQWLDLPVNKVVPPVLSTFSPTPQTDIAITWVTPVSGVSTVHFGVKDLAENTYTVVNTDTVVGGSGIVHSAFLTGLESNTTYRYQVVTDGVYTSEEFTFTTAPETDEFMFVVGSDSQLGLIKPVVDSMGMEDPRFVLHCGDLVVNGQRTDEWYEMTQSYFPFLSNFTMIPIHGNHDETSEFMLQLWKHPTNGSAANDGHWYSLDYNNVHLIGLSTYKDYSEGSEQYNWLENDLQNISADIDHVLVYFHPSIYVSTGYHGPDYNARAVFDPLFQTYGVDLVFTGHNHFYERNSLNGTEYFTVGGMCQWLKDFNFDSKPYTEWSEKVNHYCRVYIKGEEVRVEMIRMDGTIGDAFSSVTTIIRADGDANDWHTHDVDPLALDSDQAQNGTNYKMDSLRVATDDHYFYFGFTAKNQAKDLHYGLYIDTDNTNGSGAVEDPWGASVTASNGHLPEVSIYAFEDANLDILETDKQFYVWDGQGWEFRKVGIEIVRNASNNYMEIKVPRDAPGLHGVDGFYVTLFNFGTDKNVAETLPSDPAVNFHGEISATQVELSTFALFNDEAIDEGNHPPTQVMLSENIVPLQAPSHMVIGQLSTIDQDIHDNHTYAFAFGNGAEDADNGLFLIKGDELLLRKNLESSVSELRIKVRSRDAEGQWVEQAFVIDVDHDAVGMEEAAAGSLVNWHVAHGHFHFASAEAVIGSVRLMDATGREVMNKMVGASFGVVPISALSSGKYIADFEVDGAHVCGVVVVD